MREGERETDRQTVNEREREGGRERERDRQTDSEREKGGGEKDRHRERQTDGRLKRMPGGPAERLLAQATSNTERKRVQ